LETQAAPEPNHAEIEQMMNQIINAIWEDLDQGGYGASWHVGNIRYKTYEDQDKETPVYFTAARQKKPANWTVSSHPEYYYINGQAALDDNLNSIDIMLIYTPKLLKVPADPIKERALYRQQMQELKATQQKLLPHMAHDLKYALYHELGHHQRSHDTTFPLDKRDKHHDLIVKRGLKNAGYDRAYLKMGDEWDTDTTAILRMYQSLPDKNVTYRELVNMIPRGRTYLSSPTMYRNLVRMLVRKGLVLKQ
jgi:hypothetical protein